MTSQCTCEVDKDAPKRIVQEERTGQPEATSHAADGGYRRRHRGYGGGCAVRPANYMDSPTPRGDETATGHVVASDNCVDT